MMNKVNNIVYLIDIMLGFLTVIFLPFGLQYLYDNGFDLFAFAVVVFGVIILIMLVFKSLFVYKD